MVVQRPVPGPKLPNASNVGCARLRRVVTGPNRTIPIVMTILGHSSLSTSMAERETVTPLDQSRMDGSDLGPFRPGSWPGILEPLTQPTRFVLVTEPGATVMGWLAHRGGVGRRGSGFRFS